MDLVSISASLKATMEVAKALREGASNLATAELRLKLADMIAAVADARTALSEAQEEANEKEAEIARLKAAFEERPSIVRYGDAFYRLNNDGKPAGSPQCPRCWDEDQKLRQLVSTPREMGRRQCPVCRNDYNSDSTPHLG